MEGEIDEAAQRVSFAGIENCWHGLWVMLEWSISNLLSPLSPIIVSPPSLPLRLSPANTSASRNPSHCLQRNIWLSVDTFTCNQDKILWALSLFRSDQATKWSESLFREEFNTGVFFITIGQSLRSSWFFHAITVVTY